MISFRRSAFRFGRFLIVPGMVVLWSAGLAQAAQVIPYHWPARTFGAFVAESAGSSLAPAMRAGLGDEGRYRPMLSRLKAHADRNGVPAHAVEFLDVGKLQALPAEEQEAEFGRMLGQYAQILRLGLLSPSAVVSEWGYAAREQQPPVDLGSVAMGDGISDAALAALSPRLPAYQRLLVALETYRDIEARGGWPTLTPVATRAEVNPVALRERLAVEGYVGASGDELRDAVLAFQTQHGLITDGVVGPKTLAALNVTAAQRAAQITYNLERLRWLPPDLPAPRLEVNVPAYALTLVGGDEPWAARVVVGSPRHRTPLFQGLVETVVIYPPWTVPASITRNEILPRLRRDPGYLRRNDMVILNRADDPYGDLIDWSLARGVGGIWLQQQPGENNALGLFKFDIPNPFGVYLHDTPVKVAFGRAERALSHGCVRVEHPEQLARVLLRDQLAREPDLIQRTLAGQDTRRLPLSKALPLFILYQTAVVDEDGNTHFLEDIYGYDRRMAALMADGRGDPPVQVAMAVPCHAVAG